MKVSQAINVGVLADGDGEGSISMVHSHHISAGVTVVLRLDRAPLAGGINYFLAYLKPFFTVGVANTVEIVDMASHGADQTRKASSGILLGGGEPEAAFSQGSLCSALFQGAMKVKPMTSCSSCGSVAFCGT